MSELRTCQHLRTSGNLCQSPALRHNTLCYFHYRLAQREQRRLKLGGAVSAAGNTGIELPLLEDAESIQVAIIEVARALVDQRIDEKRAGLLLYSFQLALQNLRNLKPQTSETAPAPYVIDAKDSHWEGALENPVDPDSSTFHREPDTDQIVAQPQSETEGRSSLREILKKLKIIDETDPEPNHDARKPVASVSCALNPLENTYS